MHGGSPNQKSTFGDRTGECCLPMVDMTDGADVEVGFVPLEHLLTAHGRIASG